MKKARLFLTIPLALALVAAIPVATYAGGKTHDMKAEVVSIDTKANQITIKDEKGENHTAPLLQKAVQEAAALKAGDKVVVTCKDDDKGAHEGVIAIKKS